ncbi:MAG: hypothetical protein AAF771_05995 [Pseudomonadota bacterium]
MRKLLLIAACSAVATTAIADPAQIVEIDAVERGGAWQFSVTLLHEDTGWDDYADGWRIEAPDGTVLGTRELLHPHVNEQPFTRSLSGVEVPEDLGEIVVRARTNVDGWDDATVSAELPR